MKAETASLTDKDKAKRKELHHIACISCDFLIFVFFVCGVVPLSFVSRLSLSRVKGLPKKVRKMSL